MIDRQKTRQDQDPTAQPYRKLSEFMARINEWGDVAPMVCFTDALISSGDTIQALLPPAVLLDDISAGNIIAAFQYANIKTGGKVEEFYGLEDTQKWKQIIAETLAKKEKADIFLENINRPQQMTSPRRGVTLEYILRKRFQGGLVSGVDAGSGPHIVSRLIGTEFLQDSAVEEALVIGGEVIPPLVKIKVGLGLDINSPDDLDWVLASPWPLVENYQGTATLKEAVTLARQKTEGFPFEQVDLRDQKEAEKLMLAHMDRIDFIYTSFLLGRMYGNVRTAELQFLPLVESVLSEGGIWVNVDTTTMVCANDNLNQENYEVHVWEKRDGKVHLLAIPFIIDNTQTNIGIVNVEEFKKI